VNLSSWLFLIALILLNLLFGVFRRNAEQKAQSVDACSENLNFHKKASPLLCNEKLSLSDATAYDFAALKGISLNTGRKIVSYLKEHPRASFDELLELPGIGAKTLQLLKNNFHR
jgi:DNA uptake protein ComE-like DNA-binding protein